MRCALLAPILLLAACVPGTGDPLADRVAREIAPFSPCLTLGETRVHLAEDGAGPPAMLVPEAFRDPAVRTAARSVATSWPRARTSQPQILPFGALDSCPAGVGKALRAGSFAFVSYHDPGGTIGAVAFRRLEGRWREVERVRLGYW